MKRITFIFLAVLVAGFSSCKRDSDVLATYKGGQVTRGEFYSWLNTMRIPKENIIKKKSLQEKKIKDIVLNRLVAEEAIKNGYDKSDDFKFLHNLLKGKFYSDYIKKKMSENTDFKEELARARIIKLYVKNYKIEKNKRVKLSAAEVNKMTGEKKSQAESIIKELDSGADFAELAQKYSDDYTKKNGGDIGFFNRMMKGPEFSDAAYALKPGEYTKQPVQIGDSLYIIKLEEKKEVTQDNIEDVIGDKAKADRIKKGIIRNKARSDEQDLAKASDVVDNIDKGITQKNPATQLFKIGDEVYTVGDFNNLINFIEKKRKDSAPQASLDNKVKIQILKRLFNERLFMREAIKQNVEKEKEFIDGWTVYQSMALAGYYKNDIVSGKATVTAKEVRDEYEKNKDRLYARKQKAGDKTVKKVMPFNEVSKRIEGMLQNRKQAAQRREWEAELLKKAEYKINMSKLEGE